MEIETKVISMETIKPSSPTPNPLQKHLLSSLDQSTPPIFIPMLYLFASNPKIPNSEKSKRLKQSLSETLSRFYPLAGTLVGNDYVNCNDGSAPFFEAEANCDLIQVIPSRSRNLKVLDKFLPFKVEESQDFCMSVQTTYFRCGGVALGILMSHKIADASSFFMFANAWAAAAVDGDCSSSPLPKFDAAAYFPPLQENSGTRPAGSIRREDIVARTFTFPAATISLLQERYSGGGHRPSRVEALSAFIRAQLLSATGEKFDLSHITVLSHTVNLRSRVDPALSENHFGNIVGVSHATPAAEDGGVEVVRKIREAVRGANVGFVAGTRLRELIWNEMVFQVSFSSMCRFPSYEADFGWGRPVWVGLGQMPFKNCVNFMDTESGGGIEASIHLSNQDMLKFEAAFELSSHYCEMISLPSDNIDHDPRSIAFSY